SGRAIHAGPRTAVGRVALPMLRAARRPEAEPAVPEIRAVRTIAVERRAPGVPITVTGSIEAVDEPVLGFRIAGRVLENDLKLGQQAMPGEGLARLGTQNQANH